MNEPAIKTPRIFPRLEEAMHFIFESLGSEIRMATPLGLGKPNQLINQIYDKVAADPKCQLQIFTALSLTVPQPREELSQRFLGPFANRHWGPDYPHLKYYQAAQKNALPPNIKVHEFYFQAGSAIGSSQLQRFYQSVNYTHVAENLLRENVNVVVQLIASKVVDGHRRYSLSCNPDLTLDVADHFAQARKPLLIIGVVHPDLPFLEAESEVDESFFNVIVDSPEVKHELFALPRTPISFEDHLIGFYASLLVEDGGTIQIGIGSLSEAIVYSLTERHRNNESYRKIANVLSPSAEHLEPFRAGLYGLTEMLTDGFMHLRRAGILTREVRDEISGQKTFVHGSFFLGSKEFYEWLRSLPPTERVGLRMARVSKVNDLYDPNEILLRQQRVKAHLFNTCMQASLLGEASSETLPDGKVVSGVGGQYNFVAMAHELKGARSVLMLRSTREHKGKRVSNIVWRPGHVTIPRHLRDIVITEYGIADLRGNSDEDCICEMLKITDSEFQPALLAEAKRAQKISADYEIPAAFTRNTPAELREKIKGLKTIANGYAVDRLFPPFPFGSDFTPEEERLALALQDLQEDQYFKLRLLRRVFAPSPTDQFKNELTRLGLDSAGGLKVWLYRRLVTNALYEHARWSFGPGNQ